MKHYRVILIYHENLRTALRDLSSDVSEKIEEGWIPAGGVQIVKMDGFFYVAQAISNR